MATKIRLMRLLQEVRGHALIMNRRPAPRQPTLYLMQLRARSAEVRSPKRRLAIKVASNPGANIPLPIKIRYVKGDGLAFPLALG